MRVLIRIVTLLALLTAGPVLAEERITSFVSDIGVSADGALDVVETIRLVSEGAEIKRGIQRDFPTRYPNGVGRRVRVGFDVIAVGRDGHPEPYRLMAMDNGQRVRIGDADTLLPPGDHVFTIHYRTTRQIGFFGDFDELYWNVTGTGWTFPIELAEARITLPTAAPFGKRAVYTGAQGETGQDATVIAEQPGRIAFRTTRRLAPGEGLTVAAAWRKGVVAAPGRASRAVWMLQEVGPLVLAIGGVLAILACMAATVWRVRRNPDRRPLVPLFTPPDDLSAAALRLIWRQTFDDRAFSAAIVDSAVRGRLRIVETAKRWGKPLRTLEKTDSTAKLPPAEQKMVGRLFKRDDAVPLTRANHATLIPARAALENELDRLYGEDRYFSDAAKRQHRGWQFFVGLLLLTALALAVAGGAAPATTILGILGGIAVALVALRLLSRGRAKLAKEAGGLRLLSWTGSALVWMALFPLGGALLVLGVTSGNPLPMAIPLIAIPFIALAHSQLRAPTEMGWPMRDRILGFRHYLSITEEDRLDRLNPPERTAALFERYLPYAIALDVENRWAKRFTGVLAAAAIDGNATTGVSWYSGRADPWTQPTIFTTAIGSALSSTIASAATAPGSSGGSSGGSSSSGSSGGGSSGGGGGGGGGSGW